jgi:hypothetical protein
MRRSVQHDFDRLESIAGCLQDPSRRGEHTRLTQAIGQKLAPLRRLGQLEDELATSFTQLRADPDEVGRLVEIALSQFATGMHWRRRFVRRPLNSHHG